MAPDGKSLITSVGSEDHTVWLHDKDGDHQISSEGNASWPTFSSDGQSLYFLLANGQTPGAELWRKDLNSGKMDNLLPNYPMQGYSVSQDGKEIAFSMKDEAGRSNLWVAPTSRRSSPVHVSSAAVEDSPFFLPDGDLAFRAIEGQSNFLYRMKPDGTGRRKIIPQRILDVTGVSPDGRWIFVASPNSSEEHPTSMKAVALDGSASVPLCVIYCTFNWDSVGKSVYLSFPELHEGTYVIPVTHDSGLPKIPPAGIAGVEDLANAKSIPWNVGSAINPSVYAYTRENTRRNLYRIPLP